MTTRVVTDASTIEGSAVLTSASAAFTASDLEATLTDTAGAIDGHVTIIRLLSRAHAIMSAPATSSQSSDTVTIDPVPVPEDFALGDPLATGIPNPPIFVGTEPDDDEVLAYDATTNSWVPRARGSGGGGGWNPIYVPHTHEGPYVASDNDLVLSDGIEVDLSTLTVGAQVAVMTFIEDVNVVDTAHDVTWVVSGHDHIAGVTFVLTPDAFNSEAPGWWHPLFPSLTGDVEAGPFLGGTVVNALQGLPLALGDVSTAGQVIAWDGTTWVPQSPDTLPGLTTEVTVNDGPPNTGLLALEIPSQPVAQPSGIPQPMPPLIGRAFGGTNIPIALGDGALPNGVCVGQDQNLYVADARGLVWKITAEGEVSVFATLEGANPVDICPAADGNLYVAAGNGIVWQITLEGVVTSYPLAPQIDPPDVQFVAICAGTGAPEDMSVYVADSSNGLWQLSIKSGPIGNYILLHGTPVTAVCASYDGNISCADTSGNLVTFAADGTQVASCTPGLTEPVTAMCVWREVNWAVTAASWAAFRGVDAVGPYPVEGANLTGLAAGAGGDLWASDADGGLWIIQNPAVAIPNVLGTSVLPTFTKFDYSGTNFGICSGLNGSLVMTDNTNGNITVWPFTLLTGGLSVDDGILFARNMPTANPDTQDQVWIDDGVLTVGSGGGGGGGGGRIIYGTGQDGPAVVPATSRTVTDAVLTPGSATLTSDTADFTDDDLNTFLSDDPNVLAFGLGAINPGTRILAVISATEVTMTEAANASADSAADDYVAIGYNVVQGGLAYTDVTIEEGATFVLQPGKTAGALDGPILFGTGTFTIDGALDLSGGDADGIESGTNPLGPANDGAAGTTGAGTVGGADVDYPYAPGTGGAGGSGSTASPNDTPGGPTLIFPKWSVSLANDPMVIRSGSNQYANGLFSGPWPGCPGSSGGGDGVNSSGGGGGAGLGALIAFPHIVHGPENNYILTGGNGGTPVDTVATLGADSPVTLPLTIDTGTNDEFVYTPAATGIPEIFTMAPVTLATLADALTAMGAAVGSSAEAFSTLVTPSDGGDGFIELTTVATGSAQNGSTISFGANDVAADLGFTGNPDTFSNALDAGNCGGGGGGAAGWWMTISQDLTGTANITGAGGVGGAGSGTGTNGAPGSDGFVIHVIN